ncbi:N-acetylglucosamine-6-phosphate deacetylase [compost metagenome]
MVNMAGVSLEEAVRMISKTPARIMGLENRKGSLITGKDADVVVFDERVNVQHTIVNGRLVYSRA